jgi:hypothetical protein
MLEEFARSPKTRGSKGGKIKSSRYDDLKDFVFTTYEAKYLRLSNRQAAIRIWDETPHKLRTLLTTDDPQHRCKPGSVSTRSGSVTNGVASHLLALTYAFSSYTYTCTC